MFRAVAVDAPAPVLFRWLCQLRVAPYSYDRIDNFGRRSPQSLTPGLDELAAGQTLMGAFELVSFERDRQITALVRGGLGRRLFGDLAASYVVAPAAHGRSRLIVKLVVPKRRGLVSWLWRNALAWGDLVMMRRQLLNLKSLAERTARESAA